MYVVVKLLLLSLVFIWSCSALLFVCFSCKLFNSIESNLKLQQNVSFMCSHAHKADSDCCNNPLDMEDLICAFAGYLTEFLLYW